MDSSSTSSQLDAAGTLPRGFLRMDVPTARKLGLLPPAKGGKKRKRGGANDPQRLLFEELRRQFGDAVAWEVPAEVPGRKFSIDCAFKDVRVAVEVDGFRYHRSLSAFTKDRERQNLLVIAGWAVLRFTPGRIFRDRPGIVDEVDTLLRQRRRPPAG